MAIAVSVPGKTKSGGGGVGSIIGTVVGAVAGGYFGGGSGALAGAGAGGAVGGTVGNLVSKPEQSQPATPQLEDSAVSRRLSSMQDDHSEILKQGIMSLSQLPEDIRKLTAEPMITAYQQSLLRNQGVG